METAYDIYMRLDDKRLVWVDRVKGQEEAHRRAALLASTTSAEYLIYDFRRRFILEIANPESIGLTA